MKFFNLLKKEVRELLNFQTFIGMFLSVFILMGMGTIMNSTMNEALTSSDIAISDNDNTEFTKSIISTLEKEGYEIKLIDTADKNGNYPEIMSLLGVDELIIFPEGFTESIENNKPAELHTVCVMKSATSITATISGEALYDAAKDISSIVTEKVYDENFSLSEDDIGFVSSPVRIVDNTVVGDKSAEIGVPVVGSMTMMQNLMIVMVIFILVMFASQMIITAVSTEKIDKTLETLLSAPVSRVSIVASKMLAATIVAIINAGAYMLGFSSYMSGMLGGNTAESISESALEEGLDIMNAINTLGLSLSLSDYALIGLQMFMTIMIALVCSLMLGVLANDVKATQTLTMPIMIAIMFPFLISVMSDINTLPALLKTIMYIIPFTHTFISIDNLVSNDMTLYWIGLGYQILFFIVCMFFAVRLFTTDKIFTVSLSFGKKKKNPTEE